MENMGKGIDSNASHAKVNVLISALIYLQEHNLLEGSIPLLGRMVNMSRFILNNNKLSGPIPSDWSTLPDLTALSISDNALTGTIPAPADQPNLNTELCKSTAALQCIVMRTCRLAADLPHFIGTPCSAGHMLQGRLSTACHT